MNDEFKDFDLTPTLSFDVVPDENINLVKEKVEVNNEEKKTEVNIIKEDVEVKNDEISEKSKGEKFNNIGKFDYK